MSTATRNQRTPLFAQRNAVVGQVTNSLSAIPNRTTTPRIIGSITFAFAVIAFIFIGLSAAVLVAIVGLLILAMVLMDYVITLVTVDKQILALSQQMVRLDLGYYRFQSISTCMNAKTLKESEEKVSWFQNVLEDS